MIDTPVLIVGGGPVGLTASIYLSHFGINSLLAERHPGTAVLPKARGLNTRTMEMYRQMGVEDAIRAVAMPDRFSEIIWTESLAGAEINRLQPSRAAASQAYSVTTNCGCSQDILEPVLRQRAEEVGPGRLRFSTEVVDLECHADGVRAKLRGADGHTEEIRARYLIAADGSQSKIRNQLGIERDGQRDVYDSVNIHCKVDLTQWVSHRPARLYLVEQPELRGTFMTINGTDRWGFLVTSLSHYGFTPEQFTSEFCTDIIRRAIGAGGENVAVEVLGVSAWKASALVAQRYRSGPVFLAGDAAHEMPPTGGFGLNSGVQDTQNLAWKLASVIRGDAGDSLLDTYEVERRPIGLAVVNSSLLNALSMGRTSRQATAVLPRKEFLNEIGLIFGAKYESAAVVPDGTTVEVNDPVVDYVPSAVPGCRAPHVRLTRGEKALSTLDLLGRGFVLMTAPQGSAWRDAAARVPHLAMDSIVIGEDIIDTDGQWLKAYGLEPDGAVLVRPDGHIGWRSRSAGNSADEVLGAALDAMLCRETEASAS